MCRCRQNYGQNKQQQDDSTTEKKIDSIDAESDYVFHCVCLSPQEFTATSFIKILVFSTPISRGRLIIN